jgi:hypothetical protein
MIRDQFIAHHKAVVDGFRWRSREIARIEGFSDACFGFAVTLLIISLEVPKTSTELFEAMHGFIPFLATFWVLAGIWYAQFLFFRRYGLEDRVTVILNLVLLFTVLFFVYPLKFLFTVMIADPRMRMTLATAHGVEPVILPQHKPYLFLIFGLGFGAVFAVFLLLYRHAYTLREELGLNELEIFETRHSIRAQYFAIATGVAYVGLALVMALPHATRPQKILTVSLLVVCMIVLFTLIGWMLQMRRRRKKWVDAWRAEHHGAETVAPHAAE